MYICICQAVTHREIEQAAERGAACLRDLQDELGVATCCGRCAPAAEECLERHLDRDLEGAQFA